MNMRKSNVIRKIKNGEVVFSTKLNRFITAATGECKGENFAFCIILKNRFRSD